MTVQTPDAAEAATSSGPAPSGLADVIEIILDKGIVIDAYVRVSLVGIELLTIDARIVIASVDTYLRFAEATNRLDLYEKGGKDLPESSATCSEGGAKKKTSGAVKGVKEAAHGRDGATTTRSARARQEVVARRRGVEDA